MDTSRSSPEHPAAVTAQENLPLPPGFGDQMESRARGAEGSDVARVVRPCPWPVPMDRARRAWTAAGDVRRPVSRAQWEIPGQSGTARACGMSAEAWRSGAGKSSSQESVNNSDTWGKKGWGKGQPSGVQAAPAIGHLPCYRSQDFATAPGCCPGSPPGPAECWPA